MGDAHEAVEQAPSVTTVAPCSLANSTLMVMEASGTATEHVLGGALHAIEAMSAATPEPAAVAPKVRRVT